MAWERENLLIHNDYREDNRRTPLNTKICCVCCAICLIVLFIILIVTLGRTMFRKLDHNKFNKSGDRLYEADTSGVFPKNLSDLQELNDRLCRAISSNVSSHLSDVNNIYIVKDEHNLTNEQACGVESILRLFPDKSIYLIDFNKNEKTNYSKCAAEPNYLGLLLYLYKNRLQLMIVDKNQYFRNTPISNVTTSKNDFLFMAMLLTAYKYGGLVASPDVVMTRRDLIECFPEETVVEPFVILSSRKCDDFLHYLMQSFNLCGQISSSSLESVLTESADLFSQSQSKGAGRPSVRRLSTSEVSYNVREPSGSFLRLNSFNDRDERWVSDLSLFCKQVVQAYLGIKLNEMEVEEEARKMKSYISGNTFDHLKP